MGEKRNKEKHHRKGDSSGKNRQKPTEQDLRDKLTKDINKLVTDNEKLSEQKDNLVQLMDFNHQATQFHLSKVKETTGSIEEEDVNYCLRLSKRIIEHYLNNN
jgi:hypothetical protein